MRAWEYASVPTLPGQAPQPTIFDSSKGEKTLTKTPQNTASLYVCGITPYDATHMGHASTYVAFDVLHRAWLDAKIPVTYVQNVTDVDDPLLERAEATGVNWEDLAQEQIELFRSDMQALNVITPTHYIGAVESIPWVIEAVTELLAKNLAYTVPGYTEENGTTHPDGDIYFDIKAAEHYAPADPEHWKLGDISGLTREQMLNIFGERGGDPQRPGKRDELDPLLWRVHREGEPAWDSATLGKGRPGWHIECTTIAQKFLPSPFTVQGGGSDLQFPHHDMGAGHAYTLNDKPMAHHYVHTGMVGLDGEKMSKSLGNLVLVSTLRKEGTNPNVIRLAIMSNHYRSDWFWTEDLLEKAQQRYKLYQQALSCALSEETDEESQTLVQDVRALLADDLNTPEALERIDQWAHHICHNGGKGGKLVRDLLEARLGISC
ncbi:cysteine--1-D-myo-inosityl 2-amino-2-deoxy-alpha-D-glucopyranoside ligase [Rothia sp. CCM 9418]|uniref:cysteine--1-D-myo-inosityl 2-amino-2-deoxy-alpha-D-glucopyranoside ligase n=1 Tax=Rothia sp. CCM 9418 TaxID=3402661 RepID=UPI003ADCBE71